MRRCRWLRVGMGVGGCITCALILPCSSLLGEKVPHLLPRREIAGGAVLADRRGSAQT